MENEIYAQLILGVLGGKLIKELSTSDNKEDALTKALLYLIYLSQDDAPPARKIFIQGLLSSFPALQNALVHHTYKIVDQIKVKVVLDEENDLQVTIHKRYIDKLVKEIDNDPSVHQFVPRSFIDILKDSLEPPLSE